MKHSRDYLLLGSLAGLLLATAILVWSHRQLNQLTAAQLSFEEARLARRDSLDDATARLARLKTQLRDVQHDDRVPPTYEEWSRQQTEARTAVAALYQRALELSRTPDATIVPQPGLQSATRKLQTLAAQVRDAWRDFEQAGSGLTPASRDYAATKLLPLLADELQPALDEAAVAETANAEHLATTFPVLTSPPRQIRRVAFAGCALSLLLLAHALTRRAPKKLLAAAWNKSATAEATPGLLDGKFAHNAAALEASAPKILVAEHNAADSATLSLLLTNAGYAVVSCDTGTAARDALQRIPFALVLIDRHLPPLPAPDLLREARQRQPKLPAILICDADEPAAPAESALPFLTQTIRRPLHPRTLLWTVSEILYPGENRESRDYSPNLPDPDEKTPAPDAKEPSASPIELPPPPPPPVVEAPRLRRREVPAAPVAPVIEPPVEPPAPPPEPPPAPPAPAPITESAPTPTDPSPMEATAPASSVPADAAPTPRKKLVRRKILPADET